MNNGIFAGMGSVGEQYPHPAIGEIINLMHSSDKVVIGGKTFLRCGYLDEIGEYNQQYQQNNSLGNIITSTTYSAPTYSTSNLALRQPDATNLGTNYFIVQVNGVWRRASDLNGTFTQLGGGDWSYYKAGDYSVGSNFFNIVGFDSGGSYSTYSMLYSYNSSGFVSANYLTYNQNDLPFSVVATKPSSGETVSINYLANNRDQSAAGFVPGNSLYRYAPTTSDSSVGGYPCILAWSVCSSRWIFVGSGSNIYTSTDLGNSSVGQNWTRRTTPAAISGTNMAYSYSGSGSGTGSYLNCFPKNLSAHSTTASLMLLRTSSGDPAVWYLLKTTDGINFTASTLSSLDLFKGITFGSSTPPPKISYFDNRFYLTIANTYVNRFFPVMYSSDNDGTTWEPVNIPIFLRDSTASFTPNILQKLDTTYFVLSSNAGVHATLPSGLSPTHIGMGTENSLNRYIRVK